MNPRAHVKSRSSFSRNTLLILYKNLQDALKSVLKTEMPGVEAVSFTTDLWTSCGADNYSSLTMHYVSPSWKMRRFVIGCKDFEGRHTGAAIARQLDQMIKDIPHIETQRMSLTMTTDSASNMIKAFDSDPPESKMIGKHFRCMDHAINNALKDALEIPDVKAAVVRCRKLAEAVHRSTLKDHAIRDKCQELGCKLI
jgi:hypothetical protein